MSFTSGIVLYLVIWTITFLIINPLWQVSQEESGEIVPGTPPSAPVDAMVRRKALWTTLWATLVFGAVLYTILSGLVTLEDISWITPPSMR